MDLPAALLKQVSLIICTVDRPADLERCLASLEPYRAALGEVIVVNNGPHLAVVERISIRYAARITTEAARGSGRARNAGVRAAHGSFIAFLDDDTQAAENWPAHLIAPLADATVDGVLGAVRAENPSDPVQQAFEEFACSALPRVPTLLNAHAIQDPFPLRLAMKGFTMNAAFRRDVFTRFGDFDPRFGPGTRIRYGDDTEFFFRVLRQGGRILFEPRAVVVHRWPTDVKAWRRSVFGASCGHTAILTKYFLEDPALRGEICRYVAARFRNRRVLQSNGPAKLKLPRLPFLLGGLYGPIAFLLSGKK